jgi:hypothetical protein
MKPMGKVRVLVVEDSLTVRRRLCDVLASDPDIASGPSICAATCARAW